MRFIRYIFVILALVLGPANVIADPVTPATKNTSSASSLVFKPLNLRTRIASEECEAPSTAESYCGFIGGQCVYCPAQKPHYCPSSDACFARAEVAKSACGWTFVVCARPANEQIPAN